MSQDMTRRSFLKLFATITAVGIVTPEILFTTEQKKDAFEVGAILETVAFDIWDNTLIVRHDIKTKNGVHLFVPSTIETIDQLPIVRNAAINCLKKEIKRRGINPAEFIRLTQHKATSIQSRYI